MSFWKRICVMKTEKFHGIRPAVPVNTRRIFPLYLTVPRENRGLGLCEMIEAIKEGRPSRANGEFACHVTEVLDGFNIAIATGKPYKMQTTFQQISRMPEDFVSKMR